MKIISTSFSFVLLTILTFSICGSSAQKHLDILQCLSQHSPNNDPITSHVYTPTNSSYSSILDFSIRNPLFSTPDTPKPLLIVTPTQTSHIQASVICSKALGLQIRIRSGGHDFEGASYVSDVPFIVLDLINLRSVTVDTQNNTAWVQSGATLGELYYAIAQKSPTLAFPAGVCPTVGVGGHFSGGGYGMLMRKYGLAADNVIDAYVVDASGKVVDRELMGEDLFWAIRGGGGGSFGIVVAWKVKLVAVPSTVTVFAVNKTVDENTVKLIHRWQSVASTLDENLFIFIMLTTTDTDMFNSSQGGTRKVEALFFSLFLGKTDELLSITERSFPELGLTKRHCSEMSWIQSAVTLAGFTNGESLEQALLNRTPAVIANIKMKSDYVKQPIPVDALEGLLKILQTADIQFATLALMPYGGKMGEISASSIPFPHRSGNLFKIGYIVAWEQMGEEAAERHINWSRKVYSYMTPWVSNSPREAYVNYRDLDIGRNNKYGKPTSYEQASIWGMKYFGDNFIRLVHVKTKVDPYNFFTHEQSIPSLLQW